MNDKLHPVIGFLLDIVCSWPAFLVGLVLGAIGSCRTYSNVLEGVVILGAAAVIAISTLGEWWWVRRQRKEVFALLEKLADMRRELHEQQRLSSSPGGTT
jgi:hypothetical protein